MYGWKPLFKEYLHDRGHDLKIELLENHGCAPDPKSGQFLWEVWVSESKMKFHNQWNRFIIKKQKASQPFRRR
jgi:homoserine trans-succinylase